MLRVLRKCLNACVLLKAVQHHKICVLAAVHGTNGLTWGTVGLHRLTRQRTLCRARRLRVPRYVVFLTPLSSLDTFVLHLFFVPCFYTFFSTFVRSFLPPPVLDHIFSSCFLLIWLPLVLSPSCFVALCGLSPFLPSFIPSYC